MLATNSLKDNTDTSNKVISAIKVLGLNDSNFQSTLSVPTTNQWDQNTNNWIFGGYQNINNIGG